MPVKKLDLNILPIARALFEEHSVSRAAEKLGMSQPAVSRALSRMRETFGDPLFVKSRRGVEPTAKALVLVQCARAVLSKVQTDLFAQLDFNPATYDGVFSISTTEAAEFWIWPKIISRLRQLSPYSQYRLLRLSTSSIPHELENGRNDLALGFFPTLHGGNNLIHQGVLRVRPICLLRADHPIRGKKLTMKQFQRLEHIVVDSPDRNLVVDHALAHHKVRRKIALVASGYACLVPIISTSDLVVTVSLGLGARLAATAPNLRMIEPPIDFPPVLVAQYWHRRFHKDVRSQWLRSVVRQVLADQPEEWEKSK
jgi:DNA-binding transcriptional LysR family regulator